MTPRAIESLGALFATLGIEWVLIGAVAANRYRVSPRLTADVDFLLDGARPDLVALEAALAAAGWSVRRSTPTGELLRIRHPELGLADLLIAETEYQRVALARARAEVVGSTNVRVLAPEDVIVHKLIAGRAQDLADVEAIVAARVPLDAAYLDEWIRFWDLGEVWRRILAQAGR